MRWVLVVALFGLAGLVLYYQLAQKQVAVQGAYSSGYAKAADQQHPLQQSLDSARDSVAQLLSLRRAGDSASARLAKMVDSLDSLTEAREGTIQSLKQKVQLAEAGKKGGGRPVAARPVNSHRDILRYYQSRYASLPADLTPYERQVAIRELRGETAKKFALTTAEFERIRTEANLNF